MATVNFIWRSLALFHSRWIYPRPAICKIDPIYFYINSQLVRAYRKKNIISWYFLSPSVGNVLYDYDPELFLFYYFYTIRRASYFILIHQREWIWYGCSYEFFCHSIINSSLHWTCSKKFYMNESNYTIHQHLRSIIWIIIIIII